MSNWKHLVGGVAMTALTAAYVQVAEAQVTSSAMRGQVTTETGAAVSGATVRIIDTRTGQASTSNTTATGAFSARGLNVGGPYAVEVSANGYQDLQITDIFAQLGETVDLAVVMTPVADDEARLDTIVITASALNFVQTAIGPNSTYDLGTLQNSPAINRDLRDVIAQDPRVYIDQSFGDGVQCAGANPRFNSLTVDGVPVNDGFGLNANGYPGQQMPFPFDAIENVAVELAPFDVQYNGFTACNINAVTKSGTNEFHGSAFYDYTDDSFLGDKTEGDDYAPAAPYEIKRYGFTLGGPILKDRLFFFGAYEKFEGPGGNPIDRGVEGSGAGTEVIGFTQADFDRVRNAAIDLYNYDPGTVPVAGPTYNEKYLFRIDANITDNHRGSFTYNYDEGLTLNESDGDDNEFEFSKHLYQRGGELKTYSAQVFSNWTDNFSTEFRVAKSEVDFTQASIDGAVFGEFQIRHNGNTIYLGTDDSRSANDLNYDTWSFKGLANYQLGSHLITAGVERQQWDVFNLFIQEAEGEYRFSSIDDFVAGIPNRITYENASGTNDINDGAASFGYEINTFYAQDEWEIQPGMTLTAGLRYDYYTSDDLPPANPAFFERHGFSNAQNLDGKDLIMPRVGFNWDVNSDLSVRAGLGLFSGGNPNVWLSNNYSNNGVILAEFQDRSGTNLFDLTYVAGEDGQNTPGYGIPEDLYNAVANASSAGPVNVLDPNFEIPSEWKFSAGVTYNFDVPMLGDDYTVMADYLASQTKDGAAVVSLTSVETGEAPDGRPIYSGAVGWGGDLMLTNFDGGTTNVFSLGLSKDYDWGLDWQIGYAYTDAKDANPMTSSVAASNFWNFATSDPNNPAEATSNYEIPHRWTAKVSYERAFFGENFTRATLFAQAWQNRPWSYTFNRDSDDMFGDDRPSRHLLYVPTGVDDPNVVFADGFDTEAFFQYVDDQGLSRGSIQGRNSFEGQWSNRFDLKVSQDIPVGFGKVNAFMVVENIGNLLNDDWGAYYQAGFPQSFGIVGAEINEAGQYEFQNFTPTDPERRQTANSVWEIRFGAKYEF